jgi:hypothetical protein
MYDLQELDPVSGLCRPVSGLSIAAVVVVGMAVGMTLVGKGLELTRAHALARTHPAASRVDACAFCPGRCGLFGVCAAAVDDTVARYLAHLYVIGACENTGRSPRTVQERATRRARSRARYERRRLQNEIEMDDVGER